ncbi:MULTISPECIES: hypothetical protein [unclassified Rickettsia]|uniref:hypothetical protein n=1 Tax=unclassified Rickettsia TaxID=114295 RepID=UPI003132B12E
MTILSDFNHPCNNAATGSLVAWLEKSAVCHSRVGGNPEKTLLSHPEFISGYLLIDAETSSA